MIAPQAVVSGLFSLTCQAVLLNRFHQAAFTTHPTGRSVRLIPVLNFLLMIACITFLSRNGAHPVNFFRIPRKQVVELGIEVEI
ncbi:MAG TPA: KUP/HAK/KT family potassium transporter [Chthoniobacterales bacterium]